MLHELLSTSDIYTFYFKFLRRIDKMGVKSMFLSVGISRTKRRSFRIISERDEDEFLLSVL